MHAAPSDLRIGAEITGRQGQLRAVRFPDLLIAATAERHGLVVIHYDADYDLIAAITGQPCEWVAPQGSIS